MQETGTVTTASGSKLTYWRAPGGYMVLNKDGIVTVMLGEAQVHEVHGKNVEDRINNGLRKIGWVHEKVKTSTL